MLTAQPAARQKPVNDDHALLRQDEMCVGELVVKDEHDLRAQPDDSRNERR